MSKVDSLYLSEVLPNDSGTTFPDFIRVLSSNAGEVQQVDFWCPEPTHHAETDLDLGKRHASTAVEIAQLLTSPECIVDVFIAMIAKGVVGYTELGFLRAMASRAYVGSRD